MYVRFEKPNWENKISSYEDPLYCKMWVMSNSIKSITPSGCKHMQGPVVSCVNPLSLELHMTGFIAF